MSYTPLPTGNNKSETIADDHAFPRKLGYNTSHGLSKREYFAAIALQGLLAYPNNVNVTQDIVKGAVIMADQLIIELNKTN
jgi:hypothetical protein